MVVPHRLILSIFSMFLTVAGCAEDDETRATQTLIRPTQILNYSGSGVDLDANGSRVAITSRGEGILLYDATHTDHLVDLAKIQLPFAYRSILTDTHVLGFDAERGLSVAALAGLDDLRLTNALSALELRGHISSALWSEERLITANGATGIQVHTGNRQWQLTRAPSPAAIPTTSVDYIEVSSHGLVAADTEGTLAVYDTATLELLSSLATDHEIHDLSCIADMCYVASPRDGLHVFHINKTISYERTLSFAQAIDRVVATPERILISYVGLDNFGFYAIPSNNLERRQRIPTMGRIADFAWLADQAYVLLEQHELQVYSGETFD